MGLFKCGGLGGLEKLIFTYLFGGGQNEYRGEAEGKADSLLSKQPDVELNPRTLVSWPEAKKTHL